MESGAREGPLSCLARLIDSRYGGRITKRYMFGLCRPAADKPLKPYKPNAIFGPLPLTPLRAGPG